MKALFTAAVALIGTPAAASGKSVAITVSSEGFAPAEVKLKKGEAATLVFTRTSDATCAKAVALPELGLTKALPLDQPVEIEVPVASARTLTFQCGMGMYKSKVVID